MAQQGTDDEEIQQTLQSVFKRETFIETSTKRLVGWPPTLDQPKILHQEMK